MNKALIAAILVIGLTGCGGMVEKGNRADLTGQGFPVEYQDGYIHGCPSGKSVAGDPFSSFAKDMNRFGVERLYTTGWTDGYEKCKAQAQVYQDYYSRKR